MLIVVEKKNDTVLIEAWEPGEHGYTVRLRLQHARGKRKAQTVQLCWRDGDFTSWPKGWDAELRPMVSQHFSDTRAELGDRYDGSYP